MFGDTEDVLATSCWVCCRFLEDTFAEYRQLIHHSQPGSAPGLLNAFQALGLSSLQRQFDDAVSAGERHNLRYFIETES